MTENLLPVRKHGVKRPHSEETKYEAVAAYVLSGSLSVAAEATGVGLQTIREWNRLPWWEEYEERAKTTTRIELSAKIMGVINKSLKIVEDRLEQGDFHVSKRGQVQRVPVRMHDANNVLTKAIDRKLLLDKVVTVNPREQQETINDRLKAIELRLVEAAKLSRNPPQIIEGELIS